MGYANAVHLVDPLLDAGARSDTFARGDGGTPLVAAHRGFYRPYSGFPAWAPSDDPQEVLDEALAYAARSGCTSGLDALVAHGARLESDGTAARR